MGQAVLEAPGEELSKFGRVPARKVRCSPIRVVAGSADLGSNVDTSARHGSRSFTSAALS